MQGSQAHRCWREEICISYLELTGTQAERRAALLAGYHFDIAGQVRCQVLGNCQDAV